MKTEKQLLALAEARKHIKHNPLSEETKIKIGDANRKQVLVNCSYCNKNFTVKPSKLKKNKRLFCCRDCYYKFVKEKLPLEEHNSYKGVRKPNESKQVYHKNYCKRHPDIIAHLKSNRYAREKGAIGSHTLKEWEQLKDKFDNRCAICGRKTKLTKDHIIPLSKGGNNYISNIQPLCRNCNSKKHNKLIYDNPELLKGEQTMRKEYLKIRDDVDLKELEKFGFRKQWTHWKEERMCGQRKVDLVFYEKDRVLFGDDLITLFDITQANLVEKVVEDE